MGCPRCGKPYLKVEGNRLVCPDPSCGRVSRALPNKLDKLEETFRETLSQWENDIHWSSNYTLPEEIARLLMEEVKKIL